MQLAGATTLVTGGAKRVGAEIARVLAHAGASVYVHHHTSAREAERLAESLRAEGADVRPVRADLTRTDDVDALFATIEAEAGGVDVLVVNAGVYSRRALDDTSKDTWDACLAVNLTAPFLCDQRAARSMRRRGRGVIVHIADLAGERAWPNHAAYAVSQAGLLMLTRVLAVELAPRIRVNAVAPGIVLWQDDTPGSVRERVQARIPLGRTGHPRDVAAAVRFLVEQDYITGETIRVDGGRGVAP